MFQIESNTVYTISEVANMSNCCRGAVYNMIKKGLIAVNGPRGKMITGKSLLSYFNGENSQPEVNPIINTKLENKMSKFMVTR